MKFKLFIDELVLILSELFNLHLCYGCEVPLHLAYLEQSTRNDGEEREQ